MSGRRWPAIALALLAAGTACMPGGATTEQSRTSSSPSTAGQEPAVTASALARAALQEQRDRVHTVVDAVKALAPGQRWVTTSDGEAPCGTPTDSGWPKTWDYSVRVVQGSEPGLAQRILARYRADGWSFDEASPGADVTRLKATRDGVLLVVAHGPDGSSVDVSADSPCVNEDGTVRG